MDESIEELIARIEKDPVVFAGEHMAVQGLVMQLQKDNEKLKASTIPSITTVASKLLQISVDEIEFFAWPGTFSSTAGPSGGCGGQTISTYTILGFKNVYNDEGILFCCGNWKKVKRFKPFMQWGKR